jgi:hypothetical protein
VVLVPADARILTADGRVLALASPGDPKGRRIKAGSAVPPGTLIATAPKARARLQLADGSLVDLKPRSKVSLAKSEASQDGEVTWTRLKVVSGGLLARVKKLGSRKSGFEIESGEAVCGVRGTIVGAGPDGDFQNYSGEVEVEEGGERVDVPPGHDYDDGDVDLMDPEEFATWGDLTQQGVNEGERAETPQAGAAGGEAAPPQEPGEPKAEEAAPESGDEEAPAEEDLLGAGDELQTETETEVFEGTLSNGTIEINVTFTETMSS